jgi:hypothetical protein
MPNHLSEPGQLVSFRHLGFENFDMVVLGVMVGRMAVAAALGALVAFRPWRRLMRWHFERPESGAQVLIAVSGGLMTAVIGNNVALAFALVGLGGFIRFRSGIKDPREAGVMFLMIGIGMACGIGAMPVALTATAFGFVLLAALDVADRHRRKLGRRRIRFSDVADPRQLEPLIRGALDRSALVHGSRISVRKDEVIVDVFGDRIASAGQVLDLLDEAGIAFRGDVAVEEI